MAPAGDDLARLRAIVAEVTYWSSNSLQWSEPHALGLDETRIAELDEAWVPVRTPDGSGVLMWANSD
ncbi:DUF6210 family protein [Streptomyces sp. NPDC051940]|uniref:DUF6210 family protein n=1 Tax=Streptomyces sp. NPDC051940 TaxID=3155675 RepID=UPI0034336505